MIQRMRRMLRVVPPSLNDMHNRDLDLDERVEAVVEKIDSLEVRVKALERDDEAPGDSDHA